MLTPAEMAGVDRAAPEPVEVLVERAGHAVALAARRLLSGTYGRRVVIVAGPGNNGADGRTAGRLLARRGAAVRVIDAGSLPPGASLPPADLVLDAAFGTGLSRPYHPPDPGGALVLAVDIPSGLSGLTGRIVGAGAHGGRAGTDRDEAAQGPDQWQGRLGTEPAGGAVVAPRERPGALAAVATVTFGALKPGLLLGEGPERSGEVEVAGIGLEALAAEAASAWLVTDQDVGLIPPRSRNAHKWQTALAVVAGSPGMTGAPWMVTRAAFRAGAGYVRLGIPGVAPQAAGLPPGEQVGYELPRTSWAEAALEGISRCKALVVGPGLGQGGGPPGEGSAVARLLLGAKVPAVVDADGLNALGSLEVLGAVAKAREQATVVTPHDGEFARLAGSAPGDDRLATAREAAAGTGAYVLLKGSTTVVAAPDGRVLIAASGSPRLATAGTGDVLSGVIGAFLARGMPALEAAGLAAHVHGRAASLGLGQGLVATDLPDLVARWLSGPSGARGA